MSAAHHNARHTPGSVEDRPLCQAIGTILQTPASPQAMIDTDPIDPRCRSACQTLFQPALHTAQLHLHHARGRKPCLDGDRRKQRVRCRIINVAIPDRSTREVKCAEAVGRQAMTVCRPYQERAQQLIFMRFQWQRPMHLNHTTRATASQSPRRVQPRSSKTFDVMRSTPVLMACADAALSNFTVPPIVSPAMP